MYEKSNISEDKILDVWICFCYVHKKNYINIYIKKKSSFLKYIFEIIWYFCISIKYL